MKRLTLPVLVTGLLLLLSISVSLVFAQADCAPLVTDALAKVGQNCANLGRNIACYGYNHVTGTFAETVPVDFFTHPADIAELVKLASIQTAPLDMGASEWGIAVLHVQADVPGTLPGQAVTFMLMGDAQLENRVDPTDTTQSPMQAFFFRTGVGGVQCNDAPSMLAIKSPDNIRVHLNANGADLSIGSLVTLQTTPNNTLRVSTIEGHLVVNEGQPGEQHIPAGQTFEHCLDANGMVDPNCQWEETSNDNNNTQQTVQDLTNEVRDDQNETCPIGRADQTHTILVGETLSGISDYYGVDTQTVADANNISNPSVIVAGLELLIPCGNGNPPPAPPSGEEGGQGGQGSVDCSTFAGTSPLDGLYSGQTQFYWNTAPGATGYSIHVVNLDTGAETTFSASGGDTNSLIGDTSANTLGLGTNFQWDVQALNGDQVACSAGPFGMRRDVDPGPISNPPQNTPEPQPAPFSAAWKCTTVYMTYMYPALEVTWTNVPAGTTLIEVSYTATSGMVTEQSSPANSAVIIPMVSYASVGKVKALPSGETVILSPPYLSCSY